MNINFFNIYDKIADFVSKKAKTIAIAIVVLIFSFGVSSIGKNYYIQKGIKLNVWNTVVITDQ